MTGDKPSFLSLFSGCGGFDLGFFEEGFQCLGAYDIDPVAIDTYNLNFSRPAEIKDLSVSGIQLPQPGGVDVVIAGPPCQGFSTAGKRNYHDPRNKLLLTAGRITLEIQPRVAVIENVRGVTAGVHKTYWDDLKKMMAIGGYRTQDILIDAHSLGVAQTRKRMLLFAWKGTLEWTPPAAPGLKPNLKTALLNLRGAANHEMRPFAPDSFLYKISRHIKPGQKLCNVRNGERSVHTWDIPELYGDIVPDERKVLEAILRLRRRIRLRKQGDADPVLAKDISAETGLDEKSIKPLLTGLIEKEYIRLKGERYDLCKSFNGKYRRLRWDEPSYTVDTRFTEPRYFLHPEEHRGFTVREAARIQGFPDSFIFNGNEKSQARLVGNAAPPPLARWAARGVKQLLNIETEVN